MRTIVKRDGSVHQGIFRIGEVCEEWPLHVFGSVWAAYDADGKRISIHTLRREAVEVVKHHWALRSDDQGRYCTECECYTYNGDRHLCTTYNGPPCMTCGEPTVTATIGAPGYGTVRVCKRNHRQELTPCGILTPEDVR
jgi:hypothetical protein